MAKATTFESASSPSPPKTTPSATEPGTLEATNVDPSDNGQVHHFPAALRRARPLRVIHKPAASIPPVEPALATDSELIQLKMKVKLHSNETLKFKVTAIVDTEPQEVVDSKVMKLRITVCFQVEDGQNIGSSGSGHKQASQFGRRLLRVSSGITRCFFSARQIMD